MPRPRVPWRTLGLGLGGLVGGLVVAYLGAIIGEGTSTGAQVAAGTITVVGITIAFLSVILVLLPPLLPSRQP